MTDSDAWQITIQPESDPQATCAARFTAAAGFVRATGDLVRGEHGTIVSTVAISTTEDCGITQRAFRSFPLGAVLAQGRAALMPPIGTFTPEPDPVPCACGCTRHGKKQGSGRYMAMTDGFLREVSLAYIEEGAAGRGALVRMSTRYDRQIGTVRTWIRRARQEGWLTLTSGGRVGVEPGPRLIAERIAAPTV